MKFTLRFNVDRSDIDEQGHVNNVAYLRWIQDIAVAHWHHAATEEQIKQFTWVTVRHEIDYKKPAFKGDEIVLSTWVGEWTNVTCERFTEVRRGDDLLVRGRTVWCMLDKVTGKPARIKGELIERFV